MITELLKANELVGTLVHVEDEDAVTTPMARRMAERRVSYVSVGLVSEAIALLLDYSVSGFIVDLRLPPEDKPSWSPFSPASFDAIGLLALIRSERPDAAIAVMTNYRDDDALLSLIDDGILQDNITWTKYQADEVADYIVRELNARSSSPLAGADTSVLQCGKKYTYHLRRRFRDQLAILRHLVKATPEATDEEVLIAFHVQFQTLHRKAPHELQGGDDEQWTRLSTLVDLDRYIADHGEPEMKVGRIVSINRVDLAIRWFGGDVESFSLLSVPGRLVAANVGDMVEATISRQQGPAKVVACRVRPQAAASDADLERLPGLAGRPTTDWPRDEEDRGGRHE